MKHKATISFDEVKAASKKSAKALMELYDSYGVPACNPDYLMETELKKIEGESVFTYRWMRKDGEAD